MITITVGTVWASLSGSVEATQRVQQELTIEDPAARFKTSFKYGHWDGKIRMYDPVRSRFLSGLVPRIADVLRTAGHQVRINAVASPFCRPFAPELKGVQFRPYQEQAVKAALDARRIALQSPTGSGKTEIGMDILRRAGLRALWVVHRDVLRDQTIKRMKDRMPGVSIGSIGNGTFEVGDITVAIVNSLQPMLRDGQFWRQFEAVIFDEAHRASADMFYRVALACTNATLRIALSGTLLGKDQIRNLNWRA